jgi:hypothetical protein
MNKNIYYVYAYLRDKDSPSGLTGTIYYIGKGKGRRAYAKHGKIPVPKDRANIIFMAIELSEIDSLYMEIELIALYGRIDLGTGILRNLTNGGDGVSGRICSEETKTLISISQRGGNHHTFGKSDSLETRLRKREAKLGDKNHMYGKTCSEETNQKNRIAQTGKRLSEDTKQKQREASLGKNNAMYGKSHSEEMKQKMKESVTCPHCGKVGGLGGMRAHHFNNCKVVKLSSTFSED